MKEIKIEDKKIGEVITFQDVPDKLASIILMMLKNWNNTQ